MNSSSNSSLTRFKLISCQLSVDCILMNDGGARVIYTLHFLWLAYFTIKVNLSFIRKIMLILSSSCWGKLGLHKQKIKTVSSPVLSVTAALSLTALQFYFYIRLMMMEMYVCPVAGCVHSFFKHASKLWLCSVYGTERWGYLLCSQQRWLDLDVGVKLSV